MPRHNRVRRRNGKLPQFQPLDLTPAEVNAERPKPIPTWESSRAAYERIEARERERAERQRNARVNKGIDWSVCLVPGCGKDLGAYGRSKFAIDKRDHGFALPLCLDHLYVAFRQAKAESDENLPVCIDANARVKAYRQSVIDAATSEEKRMFLARTDGHLYILRLNGLIKVGWSRDLEERLRAYGPDVELLARWEGSRSDETNLHRQLRPALARGREWYEDGPILAAFIAEAVEKYGPPHFYDTWTRPKTIVAGKYHR